MSKSNISYGSYKYTKIKINSNDNLPHVLRTIFI